MEETAFRLRKTLVPLPNDDKDMDLDEPLDEDHQEKLIAELEEKDRKRNAAYRTGYALIPLVVVVFFLYTFVNASTTRQRLIAVVAIKSILCSSYTLQFMPIEAPQRKGKRAMYKVEAEKGPVESYLAYLNAALAALLLIDAWSSWRKGNVKAAWREALPESERSDAFDLVSC